jgi:hypothetical protein
MIVNKEIKIEADGLVIYALSMHFNELAAFANEI